MFFFNLNHYWVKKIFFLSVLGAICYMPMAYASANAIPSFLDIVPTSTTVDAPAGVTTEVTYTVTNQIPLPIGPADFKLLGGWPGNVVPTVKNFDTDCTYPFFTLGNSKSCTLRFNVHPFGMEIGKTYTVRPQLCHYLANNHRYPIACTRAPESDAVTITVTEHLDQDLVISQQNIASLQYRLITIENLGMSNPDNDDEPTGDETITALSVTPNSSLNGKVTWCEAEDTSCLHHQSTCKIGTVLHIGETCNLWIKSIDSQTIPVGDTSGHVTVNVAYTIDSVASATKNDTHQSKTFNIDYRLNFLATGKFTGIKDSDNLFYHIAAWDGVNKTWKALNPTNTSTIAHSGFNAPAHGLTVYDGDMIATGEFTSTKAGNESFYYIAKWNPWAKTWKALDSTDAGTIAKSGFNKAGSGLTVYNDTLTATGHFTNTASGNNSFYYLAVWDALHRTWSALADDLGTSGFNASGFGLAVFNDNLIATGDFTGMHTVGTNDSDPFYYVAKWNSDDKIWEALTTNLNHSGFNASGHGLSVYNSALIATGDFTGTHTDAANVDGNTFHYIAKWTGSIWQALNTSNLGASGFDATGNGVGIYHNHLIGAGEFLKTHSAVIDQFYHISQWNSGIKTWQALNISDLPASGFNNTANKMRIVSEIVNMAEAT